MTHTISKLVAMAVLGQAATSTTFAQADVTAEQVVGALEANAGVHAGERRGFSRGTCAAGEFVGDPDAAAYTRSLLFTGKPVPVVARFSVAGGNPKVPDTTKSPRGMALEFRLPNGLQHMTMSSAPLFGVASPQAFLELTLATRPDPATGKPDPEKIKAFRASHPESIAQARFLESNNPPPSYANSAFFGVHAFRFVASNGAKTLVRWEFAPLDGERHLTDDELKTAGANFLEPALLERMQRGPVQWQMIVTIGEPDDPDNDPTRAWPESRRKVKVGVLSLKSASVQKSGACEGINFDPMVLADGIEATDDPILHFRSAAYAVSFSRRLKGE